MTLPANAAATLSRRIAPRPAVTAIEPLTTGFSNDTYRLLGPDVILRLPPAAGAMLEGHDVLAQAAIYAGLGSVPGAPPVPGIADICADADVLGAPFFVMEMVPGEALHDIEMQDWFTGAAPAQRRRMCTEWITMIAGLSRLAPLAALGPVLTPEEDLRRWRSFAEAAEGTAVIAAIDRLLMIPAPRSGAPAVVHGDPKLSNLMWRDQAITALLDWEMALNGEPLGDLAYMLYAFASPFHDATRAPKLPGMLARDEVIAVWQDVSGRSVEGLTWHEAAQFSKLCAILAAGVAMHRSGRSTDPKLAYFQANLDNWLAVTGRLLDSAGL